MHGQFISHDVVVVTAFGISVCISCLREILSGRVVWVQGLGEGTMGFNPKFMYLSSVLELFWIVLHRGAVLCTLALYNASPSTNRPGGNFLEVRGLRRLLPRV